MCFHHNNNYDHFDVRDSALAFFTCIKINILMCVLYKVKIHKVDPLFRIVHKTYVHDTRNTIRSIHSEEPSSESI